MSELIISKQHPDFQVFEHSSSKCIEAKERRSSWNAFQNEPENHLIPSHAREMTLACNQLCFFVKKRGFKNKMPVQIHTSVVELRRSYNVSSPQNHKFVHCVIICPTTDSRFVHK